MLRIAVSSNNPSGLTFSSFERYNLPAPPSGVDAEINNDLILQFEDEQEAVIYANQLETLSNELDDKNSVENLAIGDIITTILSDKFVQSYNQDN